MKHIAATALFVVGVAAGFCAGRIAAPRCADADEPKPAKVRDRGDAAVLDKLAKAERRIAELERRLADAEADDFAAPEDATSAQGRVPPSEDSVVVVGGTNVDIVAELKKNMPEDAFNQATNALARLRERMAAKTRDRLEFLRSVDTSAMTKNERERHAKFIGLVEKREAVQSKMKLGLPDQGTLQELVETQMQMAPLAKEERDALARELARELGYTGGDAEAIRDAVANIFDVTASGFDGMMDASEGMPGVEIGTEVQVVPL